MMMAVYFEHVLDTTSYLLDTAPYKDHLKCKHANTMKGNIYIHKDMSLLFVSLQDQEIDPLGLAG
jgi:hypothetical protein